MESGEIFIHILLLAKLNVLASVESNPFARALYVRHMYRYVSYMYRYPGGGEGTTLFVLDGYVPLNRVWFSGSCILKQGIEFHYLAP